MVVKVGTSTLTQGTYHLAYPHIVELARQIQDIRQQGWQVVLVSSGAIAAGREALQFPQIEKHLPAKQMLAAVGQPRLMAVYEQIFSLYGVSVGQLLLTRTDITNRKSYINARSTFESLLTQGILPIVNENDSIATDEIGIGDNDTLSALVANMLEADLLVLLTDIDGIYLGDRGQDGAEPVREIRAPEIPSDVWEAVGGSKSGLGTGGMVTKLQAAEIARRSGTAVIITNGTRPDILPSIAAGEMPGTCIYPTVDTLEGRKRYLLASALKGMGVAIDVGAQRALRAGGSLLAVGIVAARGEFQRGDVIFIYDDHGKQFALGRSAYAVDEIERIKGLHTEQIEAELGYIYTDEIIHHNDLVLLNGNQEEL